MIETRESVNSNTTPEAITTSMIDNDLKSGLNKNDMMQKYNIRKWEIDRIFKNPKLTGRRPSPKLSFTFIDDMDDSGHNPVNIDEVLDEPNPNQVTLEQAIDEAIDTVTEVKHQMQETQEAINDMLTPTEFEEPADDAVELPSFDDTMSVVEEQEWEKNGEEEVDMDDETFEL